ncbi:MAG: hypothetical protein ACK5MP_05145 [Nostocoides sp.]
MTATPSEAPNEPSLQTPGPGAPFAVMLRGALAPSVGIGALAVAILGLTRGVDAVPGGLLGLCVSVAFFGSGMLLLSRLVTSANPLAFFAVAMAIYLGQVIALLLFIMAFRSASWVDAPAVGIVAGVVTMVWQVFAFRALRGAKLPVYDRPAGAPHGGLE